MKNSLIIIISVIILLACHVIVGISTIHNVSATYDEAYHLTAGYTFLKTGDLKYGGLLNPPFSETYLSIPLLLYDLIVFSLLLSTEISESGYLKE